MTDLIRNRDRMRQVRDFQGLQFGKIYPTDFDGFLDFGGRLFVWIEMKRGDTELPLGQKLALERVCDSCQRGEVDAWVLLASHNTSGDIDVASSIVTGYRHKFQWGKPKSPITVRAAVEKLLERIRT